MQTIYIAIQAIILTAVLSIPCIIAGAIVGTEMGDAGFTRWEYNQRWERNAKSVAEMVAR